VSNICDQHTLFIIIELLDIMFVVYTPPPFPTLDS